jgi:hypothetical protein
VDSKQKGNALGYTRLSMLELRMYYRDLFNRGKNLNNPLFMPLPGAISRSLLSSALIVTLLTSTPRARAAADAIPDKPSTQNSSPTLFVLTTGDLDLGKAVAGQTRLPAISGAALFSAPTKESGFSLGALGSAVTLAQAGGSAFGGVFAPGSKGNTGGRAALVAKVSRGTTSIVVQRQGRTGTDGDDQLAVDPLTIEFGTVPAGSVVDQIGTLIASDSEVTISSANISASEFTLGGLSFPFTIPAGGRQEYTVAFAPQSEGPVSGVLSFFSDAGNSITVQGLVGVGGVHESHTVNLSWNASGSQGVIGYNVYRSEISGGPYYRINSSLDPNTVYADMYVLDGDTYYYVATAVNSSGQESVYSNETQAVVP